MPFGPWPGVGSGGGGGSGVLDYKEWYGDEFLLAENSDAAVNANAPSESDSNNAAWKIARFDNPGVEGNSGRLFRRRVFPTAATIDFGIVARGDGVAIAGSAVYVLYFRAINKLPAAAVDAWQFLTLTALAIRADAFHVGYEQTITIGAGGGEIDLDLGKYHEFEIVRQQSEGDTYGAEVDLGGVALQQNAAP